MATVKDFTIKEYNGVDYDVLNPSTVTHQITLSEEIVAKLTMLEISTTDDLDKLLDALTVKVSATEPTNPTKGSWWFQIVE